ncbi:hypothetical protein EV182_001670 [Spiromyces aspiralis]|uniref:Uncharacterized protein n=1 Tax=Spiromyces aspiralis TaxID=68401 RepID=A0ACC1HTP5_9FUNG|nr:hypothetical protein EV182_001670 [Spiromyces aspiralis]
MGAGTRSDHPVTLLPFGRFERLSASGSTVSEQWMRSVVQSQATTLRELHLSWISTRSLLPLLVIGGGGGSSSSSDGDNEKTNQPSLSTPILPHLAHLSIRRIDVSADCVEIPIDAVRFPSMQRLRIQDVTAGALRPCTDDAGAGGGEGRSPPVDAPYARVLDGVFSQPWPHLTALAIPPPSVEVARAVVSSCPKLRTLELDGYYRLGTTRFTRQCFDTIVGSLTELVRLTIPGHCDRNGRSHCDDIAVTAGRWSCVSLRHLCLRAPMTVGAIVNGLLAQLPELVSLEIRLAAEEEEEEEEGKKASASVHSTPGVPWQHEHAQTAKPYHHQRLERLDIYGLNPVQDVSTISQLLRHLPNLKTCVLSCIVTNGSSSGMAKSGSPAIIKQLERVHRGVKFSSPREQPSTPSQSSLHIATTTKASEHINLSTIG